MMATTSQFRLVILVSLLSLANSESRRICYYSGWTSYRDMEQGLTPEDIDAFHCTHLVFAFATIDDSGTRIKIPDILEEMHLFERMNELRHHNEDLNLMVSVGGWDMDSTAWHKLLSTRENMETFAKEAIVFLRLHDFDGIDLDWEYPCYRGSTNDDKEKLTELLGILRHEIEIEQEPDDKWSLQISFSVDPSKERIGRSYDLKNMAAEIDWFNLKMYDFFGQWDDPLVARHHSPLTSANSMNVNELAKTWATAGVPKGKIVIGVPFFGRSFRLADANLTNPGSPAIGPGSDDGDGVPASTYCHMIQSGAKEIYIPEEKAFYLVQGDDWIGIDNARSVREKAELVRNNHLGGIAIWSLDMDDHKGHCGQKWPLTMSIIHGLGEYVDYVAAKQESVRELLNRKIEHVAREMSYFSDLKNETMASEKQAEIETLQNDLSVLQTNQQKKWSQVQMANTRGGEPIPPIDKPSWSF